MVSTVQGAPPKRSRRLADKAEKRSSESASDRNSDTNIIDKGVNRKEASKYTNGGGWKDSIQEHSIPLLENVAEDEEVTSCASYFQFLRKTFELCWSSKKQRNVSVKRREVRGKATGRRWESLPCDMHENILQKLPLEELTRLKALSKSCKNLIERDAFLHLRGSCGEGSFTAINFFIKHGEWQCTGFDLQSGTWRRLPTISCLPRPDASLFKEYLVCGHGGLMCANVSKLPHKEELMVFNLLTGERTELPSLHYSRNPVLLHMLVDPVTSSYKVIAAGSSSSSGEEHLSKRMEVFDSRTSQWKVVSNLPGPEFGLNEHQAGVCVDGILYFVAFLEGDGRRGIVAFDVEKGEWLEDRTCAVPFSLYSNILQLVESDGKVYLFSEQERGCIVEHCIDVVEFSDGEGAASQLKNIIGVKKSGGRGLLVFPEYTCVPYGKGKLCVFNTIKRDGVVYDIENGMQSDVLQPPPESHRGDNFFSLNPLSFTFQPNFASKP